ncbi:MAG: hypothetical protein U5R48_14875 [Gammaproteobacteria bacterium]|nr:hypothetical protein [Gammaproteobacteria bacterium]
MNATTVTLLDTEADAGGRNAITFAGATDIDALVTTPRNYDLAFIGGNSAIGGDTNLASTVLSR